MKAVLFALLLNSTFGTGVKADSCVEGQHWVRAYHRKAYYKANGTFVSATEVSAHCQNNPSGYSYWESRIKDGWPDRWPHKKEKIESWTVEEKERVLESLADIPEGLWEKTINGIYRMKDSHPLKLRFFTPSAYEWIKHHFGDKFRVKGKETMP